MVMFQGSEGLAMQMLATVNEVDFLRLGVGCLAFGAGYNYEPGVLDGRQTRVFFLEPGAFDHHRVSGLFSIMTSC